MHFVGKRRRHDAHRERHHQQADEDRQSGYQPPRHRDRHGVAIADRSERYDRPPHGVGDGAELVRLRGGFGNMHERCRDQRRAAKNHKAAHKRAALGEAYQAQDQEGPEIGRYEQRQPERQHGDEVDQPRRAGRKAQA